MGEPKLFVSYSWSSAEHEQWVIKLATELRESGVDVILDKWDLREGHDAYAFMEKMVTDQEIKKVIIVCDRLYSEKADGRSGGVGTETQIISREVYEKQDQNKFVAVVTEKDDVGRPYLPTYYNSRIYIDLCDEDFYSKNFEQLLRWIYDEPLYEKPELGQKPSFLSDSNTITLETSAKFRRVIDAIRNHKSNADGALNDYFETFVNGLEKFRISNHSGEFDDKVVESIEQFLPYRNEVLEIFLALAQYQEPKEPHRNLHDFFEKLIPYLSPHAYRTWDFDNFKFIVQELFLYCVAAFLKYNRFNSVGYILRHRFYCEKNSEYGQEPMVGFYVLNNHLQSFDYRNERLSLRRLSLKADFLSQRCSATRITFSELMQADFVLFLRDSLEAFSEDRNQRWWPDTLVYKARRRSVFELFSRAESLEFFNELKTVFDVENKEGFNPLFAAFEQRLLKVPIWQGDTVHPHDVMGFHKLASRP